MKNALLGMAFMAALTTVSSATSYVGLYWLPFFDEQAQP